MSLSASTPPNWVDDRTALGRLIAAVLAVEPLRQLLFLQARRMMIRTAETRGIPWRQRREELRRQAEPLQEACTNPATQIPAYYRARFHAYQEGNLCWLADWLERHGHGDVRVSGLDEAIRAMPPPLATLLKSTEPYLEDSFRLDLPAALSEAGFVGLRRVASDHRHRVLVATRP